MFISKIKHSFKLWSGTIRTGKGAQTPPLFVLLGWSVLSNLQSFIFVFVIRWKQEIQMRFKNADYTHPNIIRIIQIIHIHICYINPKVLLFQYSMQRCCSVQQKLVFLFWDLTLYPLTIIAIKNANE